ncbi:DUF4194 domain-containing protein [Mesorhizobium sp. WSM4313]|uniref:DUF4194 domain-containing protein n=1 Tax=Mesorhizobium sp. WSM4313 TaxID=2029412 RepID=UPI000BAED515|nr:DUF4194 domain-containing protein [Mesorhizobium sp. WSM4313]PBB20379.1 hypothetical protein CK219_10425 [Mesorhizobium sp. WSM4313]
MLSEFQALEARDPRRMQRVRQVISHLLRNQFLHVEDRGSSGLLDTLLKSDVERLVSDYFDVAGYRLIVRESEGWAGVLPDTEQISHPRMRIDETLILLLLRRLWEEGVQEGDVERYGSVLVTLNAAYDAYQDMVARARRPTLSIAEFKALVATLERRAIVRSGEFDDELEDIPLTIRALVATVAGDEFLAHLEELLARPDFQDSEFEQVHNNTDASEEDEP